MSDPFNRVTCAYPQFQGIPEWPCGKDATALVVGFSGSGWYRTEMRRCNAHIAPTIEAMNPPGSDYPYYVLGWVEPVGSAAQQREKTPYNHPFTPGEGTRNCTYVTSGGLKCYEIESFHDKNWRNKL